MTFAPRGSRHRLRYRFASPAALARHLQEVDGRALLLHPDPAGALSPGLRVLVDVSFLEGPQRCALRGVVRALHVSPGLRGAWLELFDARLLQALSEERVHSRQLPRFASELPASVFSEENGEQPAQIVDLSLTGALVQVVGGVEPGTQVAVTLEGARAKAVVLRSNELHTAVRFDVQDAQTRRAIVRACGELSSAWSSVPEVDHPAECCSLTCPTADTISQPPLLFARSVLAEQAAAG